MNEIRHLNLATARMACVSMFEEMEKARIASQDLRGSIHPFLYEGGWTGPARDEFAGLWEVLEPRINAMVSDFANLQKRLAAEAHKWERMTEKFGDDSI
ncbi:MAG: hypothetical protein JW929_13885 [Anaerolineales bacterium]|nr:hypothetical protein [Anaerolineales bacterium]